VKKIKERLKKARNTRKTIGKNRCRAGRCNRGKQGALMQDGEQRGLKKRTKFLGGIKGETLIVNCPRGKIRRSMKEGVNRKGQDNQRGVWQRCQTYCAKTGDQFSLRCQDQLPARSANNARNKLRGVLGEWMWGG